MKSLILLILNSFLFLNVFSQTMDKYYIVPDKKEYEIRVIAKNEKNYKIYIQAFSFSDKDGGIVIDGQRGLRKFTEALKNAKTKYEEWKETAIANNVTSLSKKMPIETYQDGYFKFGNDYHYDDFVEINFYFTVLNDNNSVKYVLQGRTGELESVSNKYITSKGFSLMFFSTERIDDLLDKISEEKVLAFIRKNEGTDSLFN